MKNIKLLNYWARSQVGTHSNTILKKKNTTDTEVILMVFNEKDKLKK